MQVNEEYLSVLKVLSKKLQYLADSNISKDALAIKDIEPELQRLRAKAISKVHLRYQIPFLKHSVVFQYPYAMIWR